jgi:hypothetical protein
VSTADAGLRILFASAISATLLFSKEGAAARHVLAQRLALIEEVRPALSGAHRVAALDVGWVGAAVDADIVDLAGVTDESIARQPGGHTSKRIPPLLFAGRNVDAAVLLVHGRPEPSYEHSDWARAVEGRAAAQAADLGFTVRAVLELRGTDQHYLVLRLQDPSRWSEKVIE